MMRIADVFEVLDMLDSAGVRAWVAGGWGVDVLAGRQTREHRDLDLLVAAASYDECLRVLVGLGYVTETDWLPLRIEVRAIGDRWVDVHPVVFDDEGHGLQGNRDEVHFEYPPDAFTTGTLAGRTVPCVSIGQQLTFHSGYEPRPQDQHDLALLRSLNSSARP